MSRTFTQIMEPAAVSAAIDIFEILAPASSTIMILGAKLYQTSDLGDAAEEILDLEWVRGDGTVTSGSGGSTGTPQPLDNGDGAAGATVEYNNTTRMAVGTGVLDILDKHGWNIRAPEIDIPIPEMRNLIAPNDRITLSLNTAPADEITLGGTIWFVELGG